MPQHNLRHFTTSSPNPQEQYPLSFCLWNSNTRPGNRWVPDSPIRFPGLPPPPVWDPGPPLSSPNYDHRSLRVGASMPNTPRKVTGFSECGEPGSEHTSLSAAPCRDISRSPSEHTLGGSLGLVVQISFQKCFRRLAAAGCNLQREHLWPIALVCICLFQGSCPR